MPVCDVCIKEYEKAFHVIFGGNSYLLDSHECAAHRLAPRCDHCGCNILGHGVESNDAIYCSAGCLRNWNDRPINGSGKKENLRSA